MKGLLTKDMCVLMKKMKLFFLMVLVFGAVPDGSFTGFAVMYSAMLPITAMAYDEHSRWDELAAMMPYSVFQLAFSKYVLGYVIVLVSAAATFLIHGAVALVIQGAATALPVEMAAYVCVALLLEALNLPVIFRLGTEKGRVVFLVITVAVIALVVGGRENIAPVFRSMDAGETGALTVFAVATVLANVISVPLAVSGYKKRYR